MNFSELKINNDILHALKNKGFSNPSQIQEKVIPLALSGKDIVGKSQTGTGKTAAFAIPIIEKTRRGDAFSVLVIVPTRELATQIKEEISSVARGSNIHTVSVYGGQNINRQIELLRRNPEIIVGTPGRLLDLISRKVLNFKNLKFLVLDEADKMLDMGFIDDIEKIISFTPKSRQTMLFSATIPYAISHIIDRHLNENKVIINLSVDNAPVQEVEQFYISVDRRHKFEALMRLLIHDNSKTLIFCRTKRTVDWIKRKLSHEKIYVLAIHGDKSQNARNRIIEKFKNSKNEILIATDIVARGIHVDDIGNVVNFDFPEDADAYLHRIGRTARQGKKGKAISLCTNVMEIQTLERISASSNTEIIELH